MISEPHCLKNGQVAFKAPGLTVVASGLNPRAALAFPNHVKAYCGHDLSNKDSVVVIVENINKRTICIISMYNDILMNDPVVGANIQDAVSEAETKHWGLLIGADCNSHSTLGGCPL